ncbi:MAG: PAS domain S-box protein [Leptolyngbyaceae cyanobacterium]
MGLFSPSTTIQLWLTRQVRGIPLLFVLVVPFALQTLATVGLTSYLLLRQGQQAIRETSIRSADEISDWLQPYLTEYLRVPHLVNQINADAVRLRLLPDITPQNTNQFEAYLGQQIQHFPGVSRIEIGTPQGSVVGAAQLDLGQTVVYHTEKLGPGQPLVYAFNQKGDRLPLQLIAHDDGDVQPRSWLTIAAQEKKPTWHNVQLFQQTAIKPPLPAISASLPLYDAKGHLQAVLATHITLDKLSQHLSQFNHGKTGEIFIIERSGLLVASSTKESPFLKRSQQFERRKATHSVYPLISESAQYVQELLTTSAQIQTQTSFDYQGQNGNSVFVQVTPLQDAFGLDWLTVVVLPKASMMTYLYTGNQTALWLSLASLAVSLALGLLTARWVAYPILRLTQISKSAALGEWNFPVKENSKIAETEILIRSFNQMAKDIERSLDQAKTSLQESNNKFTPIYQMGPDAIAIISIPEGRYLDVNDYFLAITGYRREDVIGRKTVDLNLIVDFEQEIQMQRLLAANVSFRNFEFSARVQSGEIHTFLLSGDVLQLQGQPCLLTAAKDITEYKQSEVLSSSCHKSALTLLKD